MAKGISIFGTLNGTLGETVYYRSGGEQKQRIRVRRPANPKTNKQIIQRGKFSSAGMFYAHGRQSFFPYAFEDKRKGESNFNAFMRNNIAHAYPVSKAVVDSIAYPVLNTWLITKGSLPSLDYFQVRGESTGDYYPGFGLEVPTIDNAPTTVAELSNILISTGDFEDGDIITFLVIDTGIETNSGVNTYYPEISPTEADAASWKLFQFNLNTRDTNTLASYGLQAEKSTSTFLRVYAKAANMLINESYVYGYAVIHSRVTKNGTKVSSQQIELGLYTDMCINNTIKERQAAYEQEVIDNWRDGTVTVSVRPQETLQGANSVNFEFEQSGE